MDEKCFCTRRNAHVNLRSSSTSSISSFQRTFHLASSNRDRQIAGNCLNHRKKKKERKQKHRTPITANNRFEEQRKKSNEINRFSFRFPSPSPSFAKQKNKTKSDTRCLALCPPFFGCSRSFEGERWRNDVESFNVARDRLNPPLVSFFFFFFSLQGNGMFFYHERVLGPELIGSATLWIFIREWKKFSAEKEEARTGGEGGYRFRVFPKDCGR